jgi:hypothetical protein
MQFDQTSVPDFFETARRECPTHFGITAVPRLFPDTIAVGTIHNAISAGVGPVHRKVNGRIVLERDSFLSWLVDRPRVVKRVGRQEGRGDA